MAEVLCQTCQTPVAGHEAIRYGSTDTGYRDLCSRCFNEEVARQGGLDFQHVEFQPVDLTDTVGVSHRFHFRLNLFGDQVSLEAFELKDAVPGGYEFQILGSAETDAYELLARLIERMRRALALRHLQVEDGRLSIADFLVRGRIDWDSESDQGVPLLVVDGRELTWEQFGLLLMTFEGWQFKLEMRDRSEEV